MAWRDWGAHINGSAARVLTPTALMLAPVALALGAGTYLMFEGPSAARTQDQVMLILRGVANSQHPHGQLDDRSALEYARRLGYQGEILDVAGNTGAQVSMAVDRIRCDGHVTAIYGFSGGGYNTRWIWSRLSADERRRIGKIIVIGAPGVDQSGFPGSSDVLIKKDPPQGHLSGPKALLDSLDPG